jgi:hypothetical protein
MVEVAMICVHAGIYARFARIPEGMSRQTIVCCIMDACGVNGSATNVCATIVSIANVCATIVSIANVCATNVSTANVSTANVCATNVSTANVSTATGMSTTTMPAAAACERRTSAYQNWHN